MPKNFYHRTEGQTADVGRLQEAVSGVPSMSSNLAVKVRYTSPTALAMAVGSVEPQVPQPSNLRFAEAWRIADVGSGAGLPGIPLAICLPKAEFTLIERMGKRAGFLRDCIAVLGIGNVTVEEIEMEKAAPGRFDMAVFRAFRPLEPRILKGLLRLLKPGGFLAAWKGRLENSREEMTAAERSFPGLQWEIHPITVPFLEEERHLTVIRTE